ncbi:MAG: hypothetical protein QXO76_10485 [Thermoproteota archaeon]
MSSPEWRNAILNLLNQGKGFEVDYEGDSIKVLETRGISKASINIKEIKGVKKGKTRPPPQKLRDLIVSLSSRLVAAKKKFRVTLGQGDFVLRFDLDHYVRVDSTSSYVVGFESLDEDPINVIVEILRAHGSVEVLKPLR